ncbi:MAG: alpha/beta fold hydrolase, partial [Brevundimonas sp.]
MLKLFAVAALALAGLAAAPAARAEAPVWTAKACPADWPTTGRTAECGALTVDEARDGLDHPNGRRIDIAVAIVRASQPYTDASGQRLPPVVVFHGGPGGAEVAGVGGLLARLNDTSRPPLWMAVDQDWIFFDQRGGGLDNPSMDCPGAQLTDAGPPSDADATRLADCLKGYAAQGVDMRWYNVAATAQDVRDLAQVLNLPKIDLFGGSYGPRVEAAVIT